MGDPITGRCECGETRYRLDKAPIFVNACHCRDCQRITGSAFALNGMVEAKAVIVLDGAQATRSNDAVKATRCAQCQTLLWSTHSLFGDHALFVRLGTLDDGKAFAPDAHFFARSKHPWIALPPAVPAFDTVPGPDDDAPMLPTDRQARFHVLMVRCAEGRAPE